MLRRPLMWVFLVLLLLVILGKYGIPLYYPVYHYDRKVDATDALLTEASDKKWEVRVRGRITQVKSQSYGYLITISGCQLEYDSNLKSISDIVLYLYDEYDIMADLYRGTLISCVGRIKPMSPNLNDGGYNEKAYYYGLGVAGKMSDPEITIERQGSACFRLLRDLKESIKNVFKSALNYEKAGTLCTMTLGDRGEMMSSLKDLYDSAGMSHLLSVSGLHMSLIGMLVYRALLKAKKGIRFSMIAAIIISLLYLLLSGSPLSAIRAISMFFLLLLAEYTGRSYDGFSALALSGIILIVLKPYAVFSASFQYSFTAVAAVFMVNELVNHYYVKLPVIYRSLLMSFAISLFSAGLTAYYQYNFKTLSFLVNLMVIPLMTPLMLLAFLGGIIGLIPFIGLALARVLLFVPGVVLSAYKLVATGYSSIPFTSFLTGHISILRLIFFYAILLVTYGILMILPSNKMDKRKRMLTGILTITMVNLGIIILISGNIKYFDYVTFLHVGQGDGIYMESEKGYSFMVDGGSVTIDSLGDQVLLPYLNYHRRKKIDLWFVSHADTDHYSGLMDLLKLGYRVDSLLFSENVVEDENYLELIKLARERGVAIRKLKDGQKIKTGGMEIEALVLPYEGEDKNDASLVLLVTLSKERSILLAGDISAEVEPLLIERLKGKEISVFKAIHHGSKYSNSSELLEAIKPEYIVVSYGKNNLYGHPAEECMVRMREITRNIYRLPKTGQITVTKDSIESGCK